MFWRIVNNPVSRPSNRLPPLKDKDGVEHKDIETKLKLLLDTYLTPPQPQHVTEQDKASYVHVEKMYGRILDKKQEVLQCNYNLNFLDRDISIMEVKKAVSSLERDKAMGPDMVHDRFLKN